MSDPTPPDPVVNPIPIADPSVKVPPFSKWTWIKNHVFIHRPTYLWLPLVLLAIYGALHAYYSLSERKAADEVPIGAVWNMAIAVVIVIAVNCVKPRSFDDIDTRDKTIPWWHVWLDYIATIFLYCFFGWLFKH